MGRAPWVLARMIRRLRPSDPASRIRYLTAQERRRPCLAHVPGGGGGTFSDVICLLWSGRVVISPHVLFMNTPRPTLRTLRAVWHLVLCTISVLILIRIG